MFTEFLIMKFAGDGDTKRPDVRERYGMLSSIVGIIANVLLSCAKLMVGIASHSLSIMADAVNNMSDVGSSVVTLIGFRMSMRPADDEHPFGHGRIEYIASLAVAVIIALVGFEFLRSSIERIITPEPLEFSYVTVVVLALSILTKFWLSRFNKRLSKAISSEALKATSLDSLCDVLATAATLIATVVAAFSTLPLDGYMGLIVSGFIFYSAFSVMRDTLSPLLGQEPDPDIVEQLKLRVLSYDEIIGIHDMMVHSYGPGRLFASAHAEVSSHADIMKCHDSIDLAEREVMSEMNIMLTLHIDPIVTDDARTNELREMVTQTVTRIDPDYSIHDFRIVPGETHTNLIFDVLLPRGRRIDDKAVRGEIEARLAQQLDFTFYTVITFDRSFV